MDKVISKITSYKNKPKYIGFGRNLKQLTIITNSGSLLLRRLNFASYFCMEKEQIYMEWFTYGYLKICICHKCKKKFLNTINTKIKNVRCHNCQKYNKTQLILLNNFREYFDEKNYTIK